MVGFCMKTAPFIVAAHEQGVDPHPKNGRAWRTLGSGANTVEAPLLNAQARTFSLHFFYSEASFSWNVEPPIELMRTWYHVTPLLKTWYLSAITEIKLLIEMISYEFVFSFWTFLLAVRRLRRLLRSYLLTRGHGRTFLWLLVMW